MLRYYLWPLGENVLSHTPGGSALYHAAGRVAKRNREGRGEGFVTALPVARRVKELAPPGATVMEVGTGWYHHDAFLLYLVGDYEVVLFDIVDIAWLPYIRNYLRHLLGHSAFVSSELDCDEAEIRRKLEELLTLPTREAIYERCNFVPCITSEPTQSFWPERSIDFMVSNCTLGHIPPDVLVPELTLLGRVLKEDGHMYHVLGHDDHWAFHDPKLSWPSFKYMQFSERVWRHWFETRLEYHNRIVKPEWIEIFDRCDLDVLEWNAHITDVSRAAVAELPRIDERFAGYDIEDLAIIHSYVLLTPSAPERHASAVPRSDALIAPPAV